jgi:flagellar hook-length control protein FliK
MGTNTELTMPTTCTPPQKPITPISHTNSIAPLMSAIEQFLDDEPISSRGALLNILNAVELCLVNRLDDVKEMASDDKQQLSVLKQISTWIVQGDDTDESIELAINFLETFLYNELDSFRKLGRGYF